MNIDNDNADAASPLERAMRSMMGMDDPKPTLSIDQQVELLSDVADRFRGKGQYGKWAFGEGDFVTPIDCSPIKGAGEPFVVIEILDQPIDTKVAFHANADFDDVGRNVLGQILDVRVIRLSGNDVAAFLAESAWFRPWSSPETVAVPADEAAAA